MAGIRRQLGITYVHAVTLLALSTGLAARTGTAAELHATIAVRAEPTAFTVMNDWSAQQAEQVRTSLRETIEHIASEIRTNDTVVAQDLLAQELHYRDRLQQRVDAQLSAIAPVSVAARTRNEPLPLAIRDAREVR